MGVINFFKGHPTNALMPSLEILELTQKVLQETHSNPDKYHNDPDNRSPLQYGTDPGNLDTRKVILQWIDDDFGTETDPECLNLTAGASYGIMNVLAQCTSPHTGQTRRAFLITPTYYLINGLFIDAGFGGKLSGIVEDDDGQIDLDDLCEKLEFYENQQVQVEDYKKTIDDPGRTPKKIYRYVIYLIPTFSNPKGGTLSKENRIKLIEIARKYDMLIISDDVYDLLDYTKPYDEKITPVPRLSMLDKSSDTTEYGNTVSNGTFSKLVSPGLRTGWQETLTPKLLFVLSQGGANRSGGTPAQLNISIIEELIKSGLLNKIIANFKKSYRERAIYLKKLLLESLPRGTVVCGGDGGYFLWVTLPSGYDTREIVLECQKQGVVLASGDSFEVTGDVRGWGQSCVRLSISYLSLEEIQKGVEIWAQICMKKK